jgi:hypothetical protein
MILCIMDLVSYKNIIYIILLYDTTHYDQPKRKTNCLLLELLQISPTPGNSDSVHSLVLADYTHQL